LSTFALWGTTQGDEAEHRCENYLPDTTVVLGFQEKCYQFVDREVYWTSANNYCRLYGGRLIKVDDPHTNNFIVRSLNNLPWRNKGVWIGLHDRDHEHHWEWITESGNIGDHLSWTNWARGHPRAFLHSMRDCIRMVRGGRQDWKWHETFCSALNWKYKFICQYAMKPKTPPPHSESFHQFDTQDSNLESIPKIDTKIIQSEAAYHHVKDSTVQSEETTQELKVITVAPKADESYDDDYSDDYSYKQEIDIEELIMPLALKEQKIEEQKGLTFVVLACTVGAVCAIIILVIFIVRRRRRRQLMASTQIANPMYDGSCDNNNESQGHRARIQNEYVVNVYSNPMPLAVKLLHARSAENSPTEPSGVDERPYNVAMAPSEEDGYEEPRKSDYLPMDGKKDNVYDRPRSNIYAEIPDPYSENIYETLDEINQAKNESEA